MFWAIKNELGSSSPLRREGGGGGRLREEVEAEREEGEDVESVRDGEAEREVKESGGKT